MDPGQPNPEDNGLLTSSEVAQLKLNGDSVVLAACNHHRGRPAWGEGAVGPCPRILLRRCPRPTGCYALVGGLRRRNRLDDLHVRPAQGRADHRTRGALRRAMLAYMNDTSNPRNAHPAFWAPFEVVGEGAAQ
jgi:hypothetical protein